MYVYIFVFEIRTISSSNIYYTTIHKGTRATAWPTWNRSAHIAKPNSKPTKSVTHFSMFLQRLKSIRIWKGMHTHIDVVDMAEATTAALKIAKILSQFACCYFVRYNRRSHFSSNIIQQCARTHHFTGWLSSLFRSFQFCRRINSILRSNMSYSRFGSQAMPRISPLF